MKVYWEHTCENCHSWITMGENSDSPIPEDMVCPFDHPAKTSEQIFPVNNIEKALSRTEYSPTSMTQTNQTNEGALKVPWQHRCAYYHTWITMEDSDSPNHEKRVCSFEHLAITSQKQIPVNSIEVSIRPAIRIINRRSGREDFQNGYCVVLSDTHETFTKVSQKVYTWEECIEIANKFEGMNIKMSLVRWKKLNP